jgi:IS30 family transposase
MSIDPWASGKKITLDLRKVDRVTALRCWLAYHDFTITSLAKQLEAHPSTVSRAISGERESHATIGKLIGLGVPAELFK